jgi:hypothetical protein
MLTDLHLQKYLDGELSEEEEKELEAAIERSPELKARLEALENRSEVVGKPTWQRMREHRNARRGSRTRYTIILPGLLILVVILMVAQHWYAKPGENSTFTMTGGTGTALELLYNSKTGWRYLDAGFKPGDSLSFAVRDNAHYHIAVKAIYGRAGAAGMENAQVATLLADAPDRVYSKESAKPEFASPKGAAAPGQIVVFYGDTPLPELPDGQVLDLVDSRVTERGGTDFQYQIFSAAP